MRQALLASGLLALLILGVPGCGGGGEDPKPEPQPKDQNKPQPPPKPTPPPAELLASWEGSGAITGRLRPDDFADLDFKAGLPEKHAELLAFLWQDPTDEGLRKVEPPEEPFGLVLDRPTDEALMSLSRFKNLQVLDLRECPQVTNKGLAAVAEIPGLQVLSIYQGGIDNDGLAALIALKQLRALNLPTCAGIGDAGCKTLSLVPALATVGLAETAVTSAGLKDLAGLPRLRRLDLSGNRTPDLSGLAGATRMEVLLLRGSKGINDAALAPVANFKDLYRLDIAHTQVTDAGLKHLAGLKQLKTLHVGGLAVSDAALKGLRRENPNLVLGK